MLLQMLALTDAGSGSVEECACVLWEMIPTPGHLFSFKGCFVQGKHCFQKQFLLNPEKLGY